MKERGIIFSAPMVRAVLDGRKTQTRRIIKNVPRKFFSGDVAVIVNHDETEWAISKLGDNGGVFDLPRCPYGSVGDRLWVRETWKVASNYDDLAPSEIPGIVINDGIVRYFADSETDLSGKPRASIHMPRWASRLTLEITKVRVERLQDISDHDVEAEGWHCSDPGHGNGGCLWSYPGRTEQTFRHSEEAFAFGWDSINGKGAWDKNPWVWVIEFRRIQT